VGTGAGAERGDAEIAPPQRSVLFVRASADWRCNRPALCDKAHRFCTDHNKLSQRPTVAHGHMLHGMAALYTKRGALKPVLSLSMLLTTTDDVKIE
jgi:hypothetical protein